MIMSSTGIACLEAAAFRHAACSVHCPPGHPYYCGLTVYAKQA